MLKTTLSKTLINQNFLAESQKNDTTAMTAAINKAYIE